MPTPSSDPRFARKPAEGDEAVQAAADPRPDLSALYSRATARRGNRQDCPTSELLVRFDAGLLSASGRLDVVRHLADCSNCSNELLALAEHPARQQTPVPTATMSLRQRPLLRWSMLVAAAGLMLTVTIGLWQARLAPSQPFVESPTTARLRSAAAEGTTQPAPNAALTGAPGILRWATERGAVGERVRLLNSRGDLLLDERVQVGGQLELDRQTIETLAAGGRFVWTVDRGDGSRVGPHWFVIEPPTPNGP